jgi:hypothetical protein
MYGEELDDNAFGEEISEVDDSEQDGEEADDAYPVPGDSIGKIYDEATPLKQYLTYGGKYTTLKWTDLTTALTGEHSKGASRGGLPNSS